MQWMIAGSMYPIVFPEPVIAMETFKCNKFSSLI